MGFKMGIVGLPNVGKSTLFNALTRTAAAQASNFPFCTSEPNVGEVSVPDARLDKLAAIAGSKQIIPTRMTFVDIAGLVKGASNGSSRRNGSAVTGLTITAISLALSRSSTRHASNPPTRVIFNFSVFAQATADSICVISVACTKTGRSPFKTGIIASHHESLSIGLPAPSLAFR